MNIGRGRSDRSRQFLRPPGARQVTPQRRLRFALYVYLGVVAMGVVGYSTIEHVGPLDALYMTVITVTTVGFGEVFELDAAGRMFTMFLIVAGVGSAAYAAVSAAEFAVEGHLRRIIERRRMEREISSLDGHVVICGFGRVGRHVASELGQEGVPFVVVDDDEDKIDEVGELGFLHVLGDATSEEVLGFAAVGVARAVVACVNTDADNLLVTITAKGLQPAITVVGRVKADENEAKLRRVGADHVIAPTSVGGRRIAQLLTRPVVANFLELVSGPGGLEYSFDEVVVPSGSELDGVTLGGADIRNRHGCTVLGVRHAEEERLDTHPDSASRLHAGDVLIVIGAEDDVEAMRRRFGA